MTEDDRTSLATIKSQIGKDCSGFRQRNAWDDFVTNMSRRSRG
jgi:hypothetical protein